MIPITKTLILRISILNTFHYRTNALCLLQTNPHRHTIIEKKFTHIMASIVMMIGGTILNTAAFSGGNYLAKYLSGDNEKAALAEKTQHDKALEAYQTAMAKNTLDCIKLLDWIETNREIKEQAKQNFTNTNYAFKLYNQAHPDKQITIEEPRFADFYMVHTGLMTFYELLFVGGSALALGYVAFRFLRT